MVKAEGKFPNPKYRPGRSGRGRESRASINAIRKAHYEGQAIESPSTDFARPDPHNMTREELTEELSVAGIRADGRVKTESLISQVEDLRNGQEEAAETR